MEMDFGWNNDTLWALFWKTSACEYACDHVSDHVRVGGTRFTLKLDKIFKKNNFSDIEKPKMDCGFWEN